MRNNYLLKEKYEQINENSMYRRIDSNHALDLYIGLDDSGNKTLTLITEESNCKVESSKIISVNFYKRKDDKYALSFHLLDNEYVDIYYKFCEHVIDITRDVQIKDGLKCIITNWMKWRNVFKNDRMDILKEIEIRGLLGELIFLKEYMVPKYGVEKSIISWMGPNKSYKDFEIEDTWYEVKAVKKNALTVKISSLEQLDSNIQGKLALVTVEKSNVEENTHFTLNSYIEQLYSIMGNSNNTNIFAKKISESGYYYTKEYDDFIFRCEGINQYIVKEEFPKIKRLELKEGIAKVGYEIYIEYIKDFIFEEK